MQQEAQRTRQPALYGCTWFLWVGLTVAGGVVGRGITLLFLLLAPNRQGGSLASPDVLFAQALLSSLPALLYLAAPLFFACLGQCLRSFVAQAERWLLTAVLGIVFLFPYVIFYGFDAEASSGQSLVLGTPAFWGQQAS